MNTQAKQVLRQSIAAHSRGATGEAKRLYRHVLELDPYDEIASGNLAVILAQEGDLAGAEHLFRLAICNNPNYPEGYNNLGRLLQQKGRLDEAVDAFRQAINLKPKYASAHLNLGNVAKQQGRLDQAIATYRQAIKVKPRYPEAHNNLGVALQARGLREDAVGAYRQAIKLDANYVEALYNLGGVQHDLGRLDEAIAVYQKVIALAPALAEAHNNFAIALRDKGCPDAAVASLRQAIKLKPGYAEAHFNLGMTLQHEGFLDDAHFEYRRAVELQPNYAEAHNNLGLVLRTQGAFEAAADALLKAIRCRPGYAEAHNNLGSVLQDQGRFGEAMVCFAKAIELVPDYREAHYNVGNAMRANEKLTEATAAFLRALEVEPDDPAAFSQLFFQRCRACDWTDYEIDHAKLLGMVRRGSGQIPPFVLLATGASAADRFRCARTWVETMRRSPAAVFRHGRPTHQRPIRLGYLSGDYHRHATATLTTELFERHDRERFEVSAYSYGPNDASRVRERLVCAFDRFVEIQKIPHGQAAKRIHDDGIDILIDLKGHTYNARPTILAHRPAPIQVSYLGFPGTTGADFIDYIIADQFVVPPDQQAWYSEKVVHLPQCYQPNDTRGRIAAATPSRADCGLPEHGFVFCCFNNAFKLTPTFFSVWMRLLAAVPESVLWLLEGNALMRANLCREATAHGIDPVRLVFAPVMPLAEHLARHAHANLFLDTLPCNAHTTASDALWAGLPVLTLMGQTFAGRVGGSLLMAAGLPELIATSLDTYEKCALRLASNPQELKGLSDSLKNNRDTVPLFDMGRFARNIESVYARMWEIWRAGDEATAFAVTEQ